MSAGGLCPACDWVREVRSTNSVFLLCTRAKSDARFCKYPPQPVMACPGFEAYGDRALPPTEGGTAPPGNDSELMK